jgi:hypothetical protein
MSSSGNISLGEMITEYFKPEFPRNHPAWWIQMISLLQQKSEIVLPSMALVLQQFSENIQKIMGCYYKNSTSSTMESLDSFKTIIGDQAFYLNMYFPLTNSAIYQELLKECVTAASNSPENYLDSLWKTTISTSCTTAHTPTEAADVVGDMSICPGLKRKLAEDPSYRPLEKTGYISSYISFFENQESSKFTTTEFTKDFLYQVSKIGTLGNI